MKQFWHKIQAKISLLVLLVPFAVLSIFLVRQNVFAATGINQQINFQGKVVNTDGTNVADGDYDFEFKIYNVDSSGTAIWTETRTGGNQVTVTDGVFRVALGSVTALPGSIDFNTDNIYLGVNFNSDGEMTPRVHFTAVPYAFNAEKVSGLTVTDTTGTLTIPNATTIAFSGANDTTFTTTGTTSLILPTTGTLATLAGVETFSNKTFDTTVTFSGVTTDITTGTNEHLVLDPNGTGNVGIGTTSPSQTLDVAGNVLIGSDATDDDDYLYFDTATSEFLAWDDSPGEFDLSDDLDINGHLALGSASVSSAIGINYSETFISTSVSEYGTYISPTFNADISSSWLNKVGLYSKATADDITTGVYWGTSLKGIYAEANVTADSDVHSIYGIQSVVSNASTANSSAAYNIYLDLINSGNLPNTYGIYINDIIEGTQTNAYGIWANEGDWVLDEDGNGTIGGNTYGGDLALGEGQDLKLYHDGTNSYIINTTGDLYIGDSGTDDVILSNNGGNVGIGSTDPGYDLDVSGNIHSGGAGYIVVGDYLDSSVDGGTLNINDLGWLGSRTQAIYSLNGLRTDGDIIAEYGDIQVQNGGLSVSGTTTFNTVAYTWPGSDGSADQVLATNGSGTLSWASVLTDGPNVGAWSHADHYVYPDDYWADDLIIGGSATASADIQLFANGAATFNEQGNDADFRVEGVGEANALFVQGSDGNVGIGTNTPGAALEVTGLITSATSEELIANFNPAKITATANYSQQRFANFTMPYFQVNSSAGTITEGVTLNIDGAPRRDGGSGNLSRTIALKIEGDQDPGAVDTYGLWVEANTAAVSNDQYAAVFLDGNVGIGTISPSSNLEIQAPALDKGTLTLSTAETSIVDGDKLGQIDFVSPLESDGGDSNLVGASIWAEAYDTFGASLNRTELIFATANSEVAYERMRLSRNGYLGIGTSNPTSPLHIYQNANNTHFQIDTSSSSDWFNIRSLTGDALISAAPNSDLVFISGANGVDEGIFFQMDAGLAGSPTDVMTILSGGNVGIGTTTPSELLVVGDDIGSVGSGNWVTVGGSSDYPGFAAGTDSDNFGFMMWQNSIGALRMGTESGGTWNETLALRDGNVGIGSTTPTAKLTFANNVASGYLNLYSEYQQILYDGGTAGSSYGLGIKGNTMVFNSGAGAYSFDKAGSGTLMAIDVNGNVGISDSTPDAKLDVVGDVYISDGLSLYETAVSDGTIEATKFCTGDGETNCVTDFSSLGGSSLWTDGGTYVYPTDAGNYGGTGLQITDAGNLSMDGNLTIDGFTTFGTSTTPSYFKGTPRVIWGSTTTAVNTYYAKIYSKTALGESQYLHFNLRSINSSAYSAEVKINIPTYAGYNTGTYGSPDSGNGAQVEITNGGLTSLNGTLVSIIETSDGDTSSPYAELWLKISPPTTSTDIQMYEYADSDATNLLTTDDGSISWTTTPPSNQTREFAFAQGAKNINGTLFVLRNGNVGIGTTAPQYEFEVSSAGSTYGMLTTTANDEVGLYIARQESAGSYNNGWWAYMEASSGNLNWYDDSTGDVVTFQEGGNVGIGTTSPDSLLHLLSATSTELRLETSGASNPTLGFKTTNTTNGVNLYLNEGASYDRFVIEGQTASVPTWVDIVGPSGQAAQLLLGRGGTTDASTLQHNAAQNFVIENLVQDKDIIFRVNDGGSTSDLLYLDGSSSYAGIGTTTPTSLVDVGGGTGSSIDGTDDLLVADDAEINGQLFIDGVAGAESLTLSSGDAKISDGSLEIVDTDNASSLWVTNNTATTVGAGAYTAGIANISSTSITTGKLLNLQTTTSLTSGTVLAVSSTSTALTTGSLVDLNWTPGSATTATGDLFKLNIGPNATLNGNLFALYDNGSDVFKVGTSQITSAVPHAFTAAGDVSFGYDAIFSNQSSSKIESYGPLTIQSGESFENNNLALTVFGTGNIVANLGSSGGLIPGTDDTHDLGSASFRWDDVYATNGTIQTSDIRAKENIVELEYGLNEILQLNPVSYSMIGKDPSHRYLGLIAQEVLNVMPEAVAVPEDGKGLMGLRYTSFIPAMIKATQEQQLSIDTQTGEITKIQNQINESTAEAELVQDQVDENRNIINQLLAMIAELQSVDLETDPENVGFTIKADEEQTENLQEWQNSEGLAMAVVDENGNIGVGTSEPTSALEVVGGITSDTILGTIFDSPEGSSLVLGGANADSVSICNSETCDTIRIGDNEDADQIIIGDSMDGLTLASSAFNLSAEGEVSGVSTFSSTGDWTWLANTPGISINNSEVLTISDGNESFIFDTADSVLAYTDGVNGFSFDLESGPEYSGSARPARSIVLSPEYAGSTFSEFYGNGRDVDTQGNMTADVETTAAADLRTFYEWSSSEADMNYYTVVVRVTLPQDFGAWKASNAIQVEYTTESTDVANNTLDAYVYLSSNSTTPVVSDLENVATVAEGWQGIVFEDEVLVDASAPNWGSPGQTAVIYLRVGSKDNNFVRLGDISLNYLSKF